MRHNKLLLILVFALSVRLLFFFQPHEVLWDSGVYVGMGKFIWSGGKVGLWEHIRPPLWPLILGFFWKIGINPLVAGRALSLVLGIVIVWLTYLLGQRFSSRIAVIASLMMSFSPILFYLGFHAYTEIPSLVLVLLAALFVDKRPLLAGVFAGLAFTAKFPSGIILVCLLAVCAFRGRWKDCALVTTGFAISTLPLLLVNLFAYGSVIRPFIDAQSIILQVLGCNVLRFQPWWMYGWWLLYESFLYLLLVPGIYFAWKRKAVIPLIFFIIPFVYLIPLHCRDHRYLTVMLPFAAILVALALERYLRRMVYLVPVVLLLTVPAALNFYLDNARVNSSAELDFYNFPLAPESWTSNPIVSVFNDVPLEIVYYPVYDKERASSFRNNLSSGNVKMVALDNCGGGIICPDEKCEAETESVESFLSENFELVYDEKDDGCWYRIYG